MLKNSILIIILFVVSFSFSQANNKSIFESKDDSVKKGILLSSFLIEKLSLQNELLFSYTNEYNLIEVPILLEYTINSKWSLFLGPKLSFISNTNNLVSNYNFQALDASLQFGTKYDFSETIFGKLTFEHSLIKQNNSLSRKSFNSKKGPLRLDFGFKF